MRRGASPPRRRMKPLTLLVRRTGVLRSIRGGRMGCSFWYNVSPRRRRSYTKKVFMFYLPLCNHSPKTTSNPLSFNVLLWWQMPCFICNHLQPLFYPCFILVLFVAEAATLLAATLLAAQVAVADKSSSAALSATP